MCTCHKDGWTPLLWPSEYGVEAVARLLIEHGVAVDSIETGNRLHPETSLSWSLPEGLLMEQQSSDWELSDLKLNGIGEMYQVSKI
jgi:ankyrin repeat protein